jgi:hypothetical protein
MIQYASGSIDASGPRRWLVAENLCLRQQLVVLQRRHPRPRLNYADRRFWILASRWFSDWRSPLLIVKPETVLGWQRASWRGVLEVAIFSSSKRWSPGDPGRASTSASADVAARIKATASTVFDCFCRHISLDFVSINSTISLRIKMITLR